MTHSDSVPLSVVILTCNRKDVLTELLDDLRKQTLYGQFEIIVVDNHSQDGTCETIASTYPEVRCLRLSENRGCGGRNVGIQEAREDIIVTLDDDIVFSRPDELERVLKALRKHNDADVITAFRTSLICHLVGIFCCFNSFQFPDIGFYFRVLKLLHRSNHESRAKFTIISSGVSSSSFELIWSCRNEEFKHELVLMTVAIVR